MKNYISTKSKILNWGRTEKFYTEWVANTPLKYFFYHNINFENFSIWWITNICNKDNVIGNNWYYQLKDILFEKKGKKLNKIKFYLIFLIKLIKNFSISILYLFLIKIIFFTRFKKINKKNCFYSYHYNFFENKNLVYDRNFGLTPIKKNINHNYYLVNITSLSEVIYSFFKYKKKFSKLKIPFFVLNEFIKFSDIIKIYFFSISSTIKLINHLKKKNFFLINNKDCSNVLEPLLISSFSGKVQESLIYAKALNNFFNSNKSKTFINYGEFTPGFRSAYFFVRKAKYVDKIVTVQHSYSSKNVIYNSNKKKEFSTKINKEGGIFSPSPDYYLLQGAHFKKILNKYYPKKNKIIGSLRYDLLNINKKNKNKIKKNKRTILICSTIGDEDILIEYLKKCNLKNVRIILSPHPVVKKKTIEKFNHGFENKINFEVFDNLSSHELIHYSDLVIGGFSSLVLESLIYQKPSVRVIHPEHPYFFDLNDGTKIIKSWKELDVFINNNKKNIKNNKFKKIINNIFYKLDNKSCMRFWDFMKENNL